MTLVSLTDVVSHPPANVSNSNQNRLSVHYHKHTETSFTGVILIQCTPTSGLFSTPGSPAGI